jgi:single-strand DNA-binding protein
VGSVAARSKVGSKVGADVGSDVRDDAEAGPARNEVVLVGRLSGEPQERELPSGDCLVSWRLVVDRPPGRKPPEGVRPTTVDTLDCVAWSPGVRRSAKALQAGDVVEVQGSLRRRFWRAGAAAASRCEVEAASVRRLNRRVARAG